MKFIKKIIFITSLSILSTNSMAGTLTTDQVQNLLDRVEKAFHEKDVKAVEEKGFGYVVGMEVKF